MIYNQNHKRLLSLGVQGIFLEKVISDLEFDQLDKEKIGVAYTKLYRHENAFDIG